MVERWQFYQSITFKRIERRNFDPLRGAWRALLTKNESVWRCYYYNKYFLKIYGGQNEWKTNSWNAFCWKGEP